MRWLPYHHDWKLVYSGEHKWRVHWFGRYGGYPEWKVGLSRLAPDMISFLFIERNTSWARVNGIKMPLKEGDLLVLSGADEFSIGHNPARPHIGLSASLALAQGGMTNVLLQRNFKRLYTLPHPDQYVQEFDAVLAAMASTSPFRDMQINGALANWLSYLMNTLNPPLSRSAGDDRSVVDNILAAQAWAISRIRSVITLSEWAASVKLGPVYFGRVFKRETGMRPMEWINERRLEMAAQYLAGTEKSVAEIAIACGYACPFYFSRQFRQHHGLAPLRYRKSSFGRKD
ncbi:MAG: AraC family transcriptional regulator [Verrucomicrobia bacterium]|nr:AraC family transcriptional regulator [Verrucomicrobiota bacterium]